MDLSYVLGKTQLFHGVERQALAEIAQFTERCIFESKYGEDMIIISEDDLHGPDLYLILSGEVTLNKELNHKGIRFRKPVTSLEDEVYGEIAWILKQKHLSDIHTQSRVTLLRINGHKLEEFLSAHPEIAAVFWQRISYTIAKRLTWTFTQYRATLEWDKVFKF
ncbi:MAG: cyclic nucleotide-binding domain-containing protein [Magnetococcus sp. YQC-5]